MKRFAIIIFALASSHAFAAKKAPPKASTPSALAPIPVITKSGSPRLTPDGAAFSPPGMYEALPPTERSVVLVAGARWPNPKAISQCWMNPERGSPQMISDLQNWIATEFAKAGIGFSFVGKCTNLSQPNQIRTTLKTIHTCLPSPQSSGGGLSYLGPINAHLGGADGEGTMQISVCKDINGWPSGQGADWYKSYELATFTHETGHAMGLAHEQERTDSPLCNDQRGTISSGGDYFFVTSFDEDSIMGYCHNARNPNHLSAGDVKGLNYLYPNVTPPPSNPPPATTSQPKGSYTIHLQQTGKCLDVASNGSVNGTKLQQWDCNGTGAQSFYALDGGNGTYIFKGTSSNRCLDIPASSRDNGARLQIYDCNGSTAQKFKLNNGANSFYQIQNVNSGKCLDIDLAGGYAQQWDCNGAGQANQSWGFFAVGADESKHALPIATK